MGELPGHLFIITVCIFFLWVAFGAAIWWVYKKLIWNPYRIERKARYEAMRRAADKRG